MTKSSKKHESIHPKKTTKAKVEDNTTEEGPINGGRNLCLLGLFATIIALITTSISLKIYHDTGDIYLDRSRPGYISESEREEKPEDDEYLGISDSGEIKVEELEEYAENLTVLREHIDQGDKFSDEGLSDVTLGLESESPDEGFVLIIEDPIE